MIGVRCPVEYLVLAQGARQGARRSQHRDSWRRSRHERPAHRTRAVCGVRVKAVVIHYILFFSDYHRTSASLSSRPEWAERAPVRKNGGRIMPWLAGQAAFGHEKYQPAEFEW